MVESLSSLWRELTHRDEQSDVEDYVVDDSTNALLSMLPLISIVIDDSDEVVRAHPAAYALGVVLDDAIVDETVLKAVHEVRAQGGKRQFDLTTTTADAVQVVPKAGKLTIREVAQQSLLGQSKDKPVATVSRPNWLKVIVGKLNENFVVVLISDVSETVRFAQTRDSFITNVSEQLLKPTQSLRQLADTLECGDVDPDAIERHAAQLRHSCAHLEHMVSDLLLLIKAQEPVLPTADNRINVMAQVSAAAEEHRKGALLRGIHINVVGDESLEVNGEAGQIEVAVGKLIDNAIMYSPDGADVNVTVNPDESGTQAVIRVLDRGVGIAAKEQNRIFERFYRADNQNERSGDGIGLGLAIVKHVALTHHGSASVWSSPGQGSTFTFALPLARD